MIVIFVNVNIYKALRWFSLEFKECLVNLGFFRNHNIILQAN